MGIDVLLIVLGSIFILLGILGSILPVLPGPILSWVGLLLIHFTSFLTIDYWFLGITLFFALLIFVLDYLIPGIGAKKFGGSKYGARGAIIGLIVGLFIPIPLGMLVGTFFGAFLGELIYKSDGAIALKAAIGSFLGFITSTFIKFVVTLIYAFFFIWKLF